MTQERPVGSLEATFSLIHDYLGGSYTGAAAVKILGRLDRETAQRAFRVLAERHPLLRARLVPQKEGPPHLVVHDDAADAVARGLFTGDWTNDDWHDPLQDAAAGFWDRDAPLWRCRILSSPEGDRHLVLLGSHHAIADALSLTYLMKGFLVTCSKLLRGETVDPAPYDLLPPIEHLAEATRAPKRDWKEIARIARGHLGRSEFPYAPDAPARPWRTAVLSVVLDEDRFGKMMAACKTHRTPLTGLLTASLCQAVTETFGSSGNFLVACPMSCRSLSRKVRLDDGKFGCFSRTAYLYTPSEPLWERAARVSKRLDVLSKEATFSKVSRYRGEQRVIRAMANMPRRGFTDLAISNLGIVDFSSDAVAPLVVEWIRYGANLNGALEMLLLGTCVFQKKLSVNLAFPEPHLPRAKAVETFERLQAILTRDAVA